MLFQSLTKISRFTGDAAGLEKSLRFVQSLAQIIAAYSTSAANAAPWLQARNQLALGRRYLRIFKFVDAFNLAFESTNAFGVVGFLELGKWSCLGMFLLLESCTIVSFILLLSAWQSLWDRLTEGMKMDAMGIWSTAWAPRLFVEAMKFWFYSLCFSITSSLVLLYSNWSKSTITTKKVEQAVGKESEVEVSSPTEAWSKLQRGLAWKLIIDGSDLFIPGSIAGWLKVSPGTVGILSITSTTLASLDIWEQIQRSP